MVFVMAPMGQATNTPPVPGGSNLSSSDSCGIKNKNSECNDFGSIVMDSQTDIKGEPVEVDAEITLDTAYEDREVRWVMFSIRNTTDDGSPVDLELIRFGTATDIIPVTRMDNPSSSEISLWVDILDVPVDEKITLSVEAGSSEQGAYRLEALVMPFDRGYAPVQDRSGESISLFSFTLLAVNEATGSGGLGAGSLMDRAVPGAPVTAALAMLGAAAFLWRRRA